MQNVFCEVGETERDLRKQYPYGTTVLEWARYEASSWVAPQEMIAPVPTGM